MKFVTALLIAGTALAQSASACNLTPQQKAAARHSMCTEGEYSRFNVPDQPGCTAQIMLLRLADGLAQVALARRCGYEEEANKLDAATKEHLPLALQMYACVDRPVPYDKVEGGARKMVDRQIAIAPPGCPAVIKEKLAKRLPELLEQSARATADAETLRMQLGIGQ